MLFSAVTREGSVAARQVRAHGAHEEFRPTRRRGVGALSRSAVLRGEAGDE